MSREPRARRSPAARAPQASAPAHPFAPPVALVLAALVLVTVVVQRHALHEFFALDDLILFQQAAGVRPWPLTAWRWLSGLAWFKTVVPLWGHEPFPYHTASLLIHALNVVLLQRLIRRWGVSEVAAFVGAACFGLTRLHFPALLAATSIGELLSLTFVLAALLLAAPGPRMALAMLAMALAVSAKESIMLLPLVAPFAGDVRRPLAKCVRDWAPVILVGVILGVLLLVSGVGSGRLGGEAYRVSLGANVLENAGRLFGWTIDLANPIPDLRASSEGPARYLLPLAAIALTLWALRLRSRVTIGVLWWWLAVLPVLPLPGRTYLHYLYVPLAGAAIVVAALWDAGRERWAKRAAPVATRRAWLVAGVVVLVTAAYHDFMLSTRLDLRMANVDWPLDPVLRKSRIAERGIRDVRTALNGQRGRVAILIPASTSADIDLGSGRVAEPALKRRYALEAVLDEGRSVRAQVPNADSVVFVHDYEPGRAGWLYLLSRSDSHLVPLGELPAAHLRFVEAMLASRLPGAALDYADRALADRPDDAAMAALRRRALAAIAAGN